MSSPLRRAHAPAVLAAVALVLGACSSVDPADTPTDAETSADETAASDGPTPGGVAVVALDNPVVCLDPQQGTAFSGQLAVQHTVDQLTYQNPETAELEPWLATSWEVNEDSTRFTFTLREDVTFADGSVLTGDVVVRNVEEIVALGAGAPTASSNLAGLTGVTAPDEHTVELSFGEPNAQFLQATSTTALGILSETSYDVTPEERCLGGYTGSGPFVVASFALDAPIVLERRTGYGWAPESLGFSGDALLDGIEFQIVPEAGVRTGLLSSGQADAVAGVFREDEPTFSGTEEFWLQARATPGFTNSLVVNGRSPILSDPDVRAALQIAIDREEILQTVSSPLASPAQGLLSSTAPFGGDYTDLLARDVDASNALLDGAGWEVGDDGIREKNGQRLSLRVVHFAAQSPLIALVNQQLFAVGAELVPQVLDPAQRDEVEAAADFDLLQRNLTRADPDALRNQLGFDYSNYLYQDARSELDDLLDEQAATTDTAQRQALVDEIQELVLGEALVWPVSELTQVYAGSSQLRDTSLDSASRLNLYPAWKAETR